MSRVEARALDGAGTRASLTEGALDSLEAQIAVVDGAGCIVAVNESWRRFPQEAGTAGGDSVGCSYIEASRRARGPEGAEVAAGLSDVLSGRRDRFALEYPCPPPGRRRWFLLDITPLRGGE